MINSVLSYIIMACIAVSQINLPHMVELPEQVRLTGKINIPTVKAIEVKQEEPKQEELATEEPTTEVTKSEKPIAEGSSFIGPPYIPAVTSSAVGYNDSKSWWFSRNKTKTPPTAQRDIAISDYDAYYLGDINRKIIYLTFDEGYEKGYTPEILDVLKENDVKAAFFVTKTYIQSEPELVKRMVEEGHIVGNHSVTHPNMSTLSDEKVIWELEECANYFKEVTGEDMPLFFRPPAGEYSIRTLELTQSIGYKTIFWSFAYKDWVVDDQPTVETAYNNVMDYSHNGCIMLLHAVSESNTKALDRMIKGLKEEGFDFESLDNLPSYN